MIGALVIVCAAIGYSNTNISGSTKCTDYEVLTTETILCGKGDSCLASGVDVHVDSKYSPDQAIKTWLVPQNNLKFHHRQLEPVHFQENLSSSVLFDSVKHYSWRNSVISGNCCITNEGNMTAHTTLEIFSSFNAAIHPKTDDAVFTETIYIPNKTTSCFQKWGLNTTFVTKTDGYFFFALSTSSEINYKIEIAARQVYVNASQYSDPQYFTSRNHSQFSYEKCFEDIGLHKEPMNYIVLCQATAEDVESDSLEVSACPHLLSLHIKNVWLTVLVVLPIMLVGLGGITTVYVCCKRKPCERMTQAITEQGEDIDIIHGTGLETYHVSASCAYSHARPIRVTVFAPPSSCISIETLFFNLHYFVGLYRRTW